MVEFLILKEEGTKP